MDEINLIRLAFLGATLIISTLLVLVLLSINKGSKKANVLLVAIIVTYGFSALTSLLMYSGLYSKFPTIVLCFYPLVFVVGPIYYFYIQYLLQNDFKFKFQYVLHFIPLIYGMYKLKWFFSLTGDVKVKVLHNAWFGGVEYNYKHFLSFSIPSLITVLYIIISLGLIVKATKKLKDDSSNTDIEFLHWLKRFSILYLILIVVDVFRLGVSIQLGWDLGKGEIVTNMLISVLIQYYIFQVIKNPNRVFHSLQASKKVTTNKSIGVITDKHIAKVELAFSKKLVAFMKKEKPFLNPELKCHELAAMLEVTPHYLSKIINQEFEVNFYGFINKYRVEEFKKDVLKEENKNLTLTAVAQSVGFNSKSSFNRIFKSITLITPTQYLKQNANIDVV